MPTLNFELWKTICLQIVVIATKKQEVHMKTRSFYFFPREMVKFGSDYLLKNVYKKSSSNAKDKNDDVLKKINHICLNDKSIDSIVNKF